MRIPAVYEKGVFRPLAPVNLANGQAVSLQIETGLDRAAQLPCWVRVYEGLTEEQIATAEAIMLDRSTARRPPPALS
jgi:predicted DNA-binding antitoxin AbrB/MazE fold protein